MVFRFSNPELQIINQIWISNMFQTHSRRESYIESNNYAQWQINLEEVIFEEIDSYTSDWQARLAA